MDINAIDLTKEINKRLSSGNFRVVKGVFDTSGSYTTDSNDDDPEPTSIMILIDA